MAAGMHASPLLDALTGPGAGGVGAGGAGFGAGAGVVGFVGAEGVPGADELAEAGGVPLEELLLEPQPPSARAKEKQTTCANTATPCE
jgi:hypothetical protein